MKKIVIFLLLFILFTCNLDKLIEPQNPTEEKEDGKQNPVNPVNPTAPVSPPLTEKIVFSDHFRIIYTESGGVPQAVYDANARLGDNGVFDEGLTYSLSRYNASSFSIDPQTGVINSKYQVTPKRVYHFLITASTGSSFKTIDFKLVYLNQNSSSQTFSDSRYIDIQDDNSHALYSMDLFGSSDLATGYNLGGTDSGFFEINGQGTLYVRRGKTLENHRIYNVSINVLQDYNGPSLKRIAAVDLKIQKGKVMTGFPEDDQPLSFAENTEIGDRIYDINAKIDNDEADAGIIYSLSPRTSPFQINSRTGRLTLYRALDYETTTSYSLTLTATSQAQASLSKSFTLTIQVSDVQEIYGLPVSDVKTFAENTALNTEIYDINANVADGEADAGIIYSLSPSTSLFSLDSSTGKLTLTNALDYETTASYDLTLSARSQTQENSSKSFTLTINVSNVQEINGLPTSDISKTLRENLTVGDEIYDVDAKIDDGIIDAGISYSLSPNGSPFQIDSSTGELTLIQPLAAKAGENYSLNIGVQATNNAALQATLAMNIRIIPSKDFYLWLVKPDGTKLDAELATTPVRAGYKYEAEVANPEILEKYDDFQFEWSLEERGDFYISSSPPHKKTFTSSEGKSYYVLLDANYKDLDELRLHASIRYKHQDQNWYPLRKLSTHNTFIRSNLSENLKIEWLNKSRNNISLDANAATIEVGDKLSYDLSDWLTYTGISSAQTKWRAVDEDDYYYSISENSKALLDRTDYKDHIVELFIIPSYENESWRLQLRSKVKITNTDEGVIGGKLSHNGSDLSRAGNALKAGERAVFSDLVDLDGLEGVTFSYTWHLVDEKEPVSLPDPIHSIQSKTRSIYLNTVSADTGKYLVLKVKYTDLGGFENEYTVTSAETIAAADVSASEGSVVFERQWQLAKTPLVLTTDQVNGERYVWRIFEGNANRPLALASGTSASKVISWDAVYADNYGFQTTTPQIKLQFQQTGNYKITLEVFPEDGASSNFVSEQLNIQSSFVRGGEGNAASD